MALPQNENKHFYLAIVNGRKREVTTLVDLDSTDDKERLVAFLKEALAKVEKNDWDSLWARGDDWGYLNIDFYKYEDYTQEERDEAARILRNKYHIDLTKKDQDQ